MKKAFKGWYEMTNQNGVVLKAGRLRGDAMDIQGASDLFHNRMHELMRKFNDYQGWQKDEDVDDYRITKIFEVECTPPQKLMTFSQSIIAIETPR